MAMKFISEVFLRERARQNAEAKARYIISIHDYATATIILCRRLSALMERKEESRPYRVENIYNEEEQLLLRQKLCLK